MNMNGNKLLDKISDLDPRLIEGAEKKTHRSKRGLFVGLTSGMATVAAAAVIAVTAANARVQQPPIVDNPSVPAVNVSDTNSGSGSTSTQDPPVIDNTPKDPPELDFSKYKDLPKISSNDSGITASGGSGGKYSGNYNTASLLKNFGPWNEDLALETLPVYMSNSNDPDIDKMKQRLLSAASALGYSENELELELPDMSHDGYRKMLEEQGISSEEIDAEIERVSKITNHMAEITAKVDGIKFSIRTDFTIEIKFDEALILPEEYNISDNASEEERTAAMNYLYDKYKALVNYSKPEYNGSTGFYDADCSDDEQIANYFLNHIEFKNSDLSARSDQGRIEPLGIQPGRLESIKIYSTDGCDMFGDYPILTPWQAVEILKSNKYSDEDRMPADANIICTKLQYRNNPGMTGIIPYYTFYVATDEIPDEIPEMGINIKCVTYDISAVPEEFIDMETENYGVSA